MIIQYVSDLHLEFPKNSKFLKENKLVPKSDILILAGDILLFRENLEKEAYFDFLSNSFKDVYWLPGNHEYYYSDIIRYHKYKEKSVRSNIHVVKDKVININGINLIFTTLWSKISTYNEFYLENQISDFSLIKYNGEEFRSWHFNSLHQKCHNFLVEELEQHKLEKNIIITHHVPTSINYPEKFKSSPLNEAFVVEMYELIEKYQPEAWIYGHSHVNTPDFTIGNSKILTNQLGYVDNKENLDFKLDAIIEV